jgi:cation:H+ antiporter
MVPDLGCREAWSALASSSPEESFLAIPLFLASLAAMLFAARQFARRLDRLGTRLGLSEALIGLLTALAADGPEISSALVALAKGSRATSAGVLVGSGTFNIAAIVGVSGLLAGSVVSSRRTLALEGAAGAAIVAVGAAVLIGWLAPAIGAPLAAAILIPYVIWALREGERHAPRRPPTDARDDPAHHLVALIAFDVTLIVAGSAGMVQAALTLGHDWHVSSVVLGTLVLGPLTSLPNAITGIRLGLAGRGDALVGETLNSNSINIAAGLIVPALFVSLTVASANDKLQLAWLVGMTVLMLALLARGRGLRRGAGALLIALYGGYVAVVVAGR